MILKYRFRKKPLVSVPISRDYIPGGIVLLYLYKPKKKNFTL